MKAIVDIVLCRAEECLVCHAKTACSKKALLQLEKADVPMVQETVCDGCGDCVAACPFEAISLK